MRPVGTLSNENQAQRFCRYLTSQNLANSCDVSFDPTSGHMSYQIWIHDEDQIAKVATLLEEFQKSPSDPKFDSAIVIDEPLEQEEEEAPQPPPHRFKNHLTTFLLSLCVFVFFLNTMQEIPLRKEGLSESTFLMTPLQALLMYDLPPVFDDLEKIIQKYELNNEKLDQIPPEVVQQLNALDKAPYWRGVYDWIVKKIKGEPPIEGPLFVRLRQGEVWRLFTPCLLHSDLLHILFNMLWLWYLGRPIEQRIGPARTLLLTLIAGIGANTVQYLMSGPFFIGYSGVVTALAGFIWMRERRAPWEGYPLNRGTILFLLFFVGAIFVLQLVSFFLQVFTAYHFAPNIANTAHIAGALIGAWLGRYPFFAQRVHK